MISISRTGRWGAMAVLVGLSLGPSGRVFAQGESSGGYEAGHRSRSSGRPTGLTVGIQTILNAPFIAPAVANVLVPAGAASVGYDAGDWRAEGMLTMLFVENNATAFGFAGRFFYPLHKGRNADFSVGGLLGITFEDQNFGGDTFLFNIEPSVQLRAFIVDNVALTATLGMGLAVGDFTVVSLIGQLNGGLGLQYVFD